MVGAGATFSSRLAHATAVADSVLCLGLDPDGHETAAAAERRCLELLEATAGSVCAVKPNLAFFEQYGSAGYAVLERLRQRLPPDVLLIADGKRGDIGNTASAYARALFDVLGADAVTVNPLMGEDAVAPFLERAGRGVFILARTSNRGAADFLEQRLARDGRPLYERIVDAAMGWSAAATVGFVVGATAPAAIAAVRARAPEAPLLLPGVGAQGGVMSGITAALDASGAGILVPVSRGIADAPAGPAAAAEALRREINAARRTS